MEEDSPTTTVWIVTIILITISTIRLLVSLKRDKSNIPWAPGALPLLGHALKYRKNPAQFLLNTREKVGDVFQLNLAGKHMFVACGPSAQKVIANAPESIMSARRAVAVIGMEESLGYDNVHRGTDLHKAIVKGFWHSKESERVAVGFIEVLRNSLRIETSSLANQQQQVEFITLIRRVTLRAVIEYFIGSFFLDRWDFNFIEEFMKFQEELEDVTAKTAVMPRALALPLLLWPLRRRRLKLEQLITKRLEENLPKTSNEELGFWLVAARYSNCPGEVAHFIIGLLFAAHKNPAIGAAQSYLMLFERAKPGQQQRCLKESQTLLSEPTDLFLQESCPTLNRLCLETLRLTAHSIGGLRTAGQDFSLGEKNFIIPRGSTVALAHIPSSLNANIWRDPGTLDLNINSRNRSKELYRNDYTFTVFSHGIHRCPGQRFVMVMAPCTVAILLTEYRIKMPDNIPPLCFERATLAQRAGPVYVTISENKHGD
ncbi:hypothetical protein ACHAXR_007601 [Thalassiosira sp. AJA248-18]